MFFKKNNFENTHNLMFNSIFNEEVLYNIIRKIVREEIASTLNNHTWANTSTVDDNLIKGVKGLAKYLGCCNNTAQNIINSKILSEKGIQYMAGKSWRFKKDKLSKLLEQEPNIFEKVSTSKI